MAFQRALHVSLASDMIQIRSQPDAPYTRVAVNGCQ